MKDRKYKYAEDLIEEYLRLSDEGIELPLLMAKATKKRETLIAEQSGEVIKKGDLDDLYKAFFQVKKLEERQAELKEELSEVEEQFKGFLSFIRDKKVAYEKWEDGEKLKLTYLFWLEEGGIKSNR